VLCAVLATACGGPAAGPPANALLVTFDTTRADRIGCYGYDGAETPTLDALAAAGTLFERAWAPTPITLPSHATILTGLPPAAHGARNNGTYRLPPAATTIAEILDAEGFATGAFVSAFVLERRFGLAQGFERYGDDLTAGHVPASDLEIRSRPAERTVDEAIAWLDGVGERRFFLWLHLFDPHQPYRLEGDLAARFADRPYDGEIARADRELGRLLAALEARGLRDATAVVATADHGESLGEHGEDTHGLFLYDSTLRVPLIVSHPGSVPAGRRSTAAAGLVDLAPTLLDLLGLPPSPAMAGRSLLADPAAPPALLIETVLPAESYGWSPLSGLVAGDAKYIEAPEPELYDLRRDPAEATNLWRDADEASRRMARAHRAALARLEPLAASSRELGSEEELALRSLGYVFGGARNGAPAPDPKRMVGFLEKLKQTAGLVAGGRFAEARAPAEELVGADPGSYDALWMLAEVERRTGRPERAEKLYRRAVEIDPDKGPALIGLGQIAKASGDLPAARDLFARATGDPTSFGAHLNLAVAELDAGSPERAAEVLEAAEPRFPYLAKIPYLLAAIYLRERRIDEARAAVARALELQPDDPSARALQARLDQVPR